MKASPLGIGTFVRIVLPDGSFAYGRALTDPYVAFYNYRTEDPRDALDEIGANPLLFSLAVRHRELERWTVIGKRPLEGEAAKPVVRFTQDLANFRDCTIYDSGGMRRPATPQDCAGLERASIWNVRAVERRLLDTFLGRPNDDEEFERVKLS